MIKSDGIARDTHSNLQENDLFRISGAQSPPPSLPLTRWTHFYVYQFFDFIIHAHCLRRYVYRDQPSGSSPKSKVICFPVCAPTDDDSMAVVNSRNTINCLFSFTVFLRYDKPHSIDWFMTATKRLVSMCFLLTSGIASDLFLNNWFRRELSCQRNANQYKWTPWTKSSSRPNYMHIREPSP